MPEKVLIADDEPLARRTLRQHLLELAWPGEICEAHDGRSAIELANSQRPGLIFLDIVMPGANGLQVLEQLTYEPSVIFTTAHDQYAVTAFELGALDYVLKPFGRERVARVLRRVQASASHQDVAIAERAREALNPTEDCPAFSSAMAAASFPFLFPASNAQKARTTTSRSTLPQSITLSASA